MLFIVGLRVNNKNSFIDFVMFSVKVSYGGLRIDPFIDLLNCVIFSISRLGLDEIKFLIMAQCLISG